MPILPYGGPPLVDSLQVPAIYNPESLLNFWSVLANRNSQQVKWLALGDSWSTYAAVANYGGTFADGYGPVCQRLLLGAFPVTGNPKCGNWYPVNILGGTGSPVPWTVTGSPASQTLYGPNCANHHVTSAYTATLVVSGTSANLWLTKDATLSGVFSWQVDSGATTNVTVSTSGLGHAVDGFLVNISLGSSGIHTIVVKWVSGDIFFSGADVFDGDESKGLHLVSAGHGGWGVQQWLAADAGAGTSGISNTLSVVQPDIVTVELGINDWGINNRPVINFDLDMVTLVYKIKAQVPNASIVLIMIPRTSASPPIWPWSSFVSAAFGVATQFNIGLLDLSAQIPWAPAPNQHGFWYTDNGHPSLVGHYEVGKALYTALSSGSGTSTLGYWPLYISGAISGQTINTTLTTLFTTTTLQPGIYLFHAALTIGQNVAGTCTAVEIRWNVGTATAAFGGQNATEVGMQAAGNNQRNITQAITQGNVVVTAAGTLVLQAVAITATATVINSTDTNHFTNASGYLIHSINTGI